MSAKIRIRSHPAAGGAPVTYVFTATSDTFREWEARPREYLHLAQPAP
jgi:hypothetical protein